MCHHSDLLIVTSISFGEHEINWVFELKERLHVIKDNLLPWNGPKSVLFATRINNTFFLHDVPNYKQAVVILHWAVRRFYDQAFSNKALKK